MRRFSRLGSVFGIFTHAFQPLICARVGSRVALHANEPYKQHHESKAPSQSNILVGDSFASKATLLLMSQLFCQEIMTFHDDIATKIQAPREGVYSQLEQYWTVRPVDDREKIDFPGWISIGGPGVDGIQFCCHTENGGIYTYHPIERRFELVAETVADLVDGWQAGRIKV
jgi:hypothetical protein